LLLFLPRRDELTACASGGSLRTHEPALARHLDAIAMVALVAGPAVPPAEAGADESESTVADSMVPTPGRCAGDPGEAGAATALSTGRSPSTGTRSATGRSRGGAAHAASSTESAAIEDTVRGVMPE